MKPLLLVISVYLYYIKVDFRSIFSYAATLYFFVESGKFLDNRRKELNTGIGIKTFEQQFQTKLNKPTEPTNLKLSEQEEMEKAIENEGKNNEKDKSSIGFQNVISQKCAARNSVRGEHFRGSAW